MEFSSDDRLVSSSLDGSVILWRVRGYPSLARRRGDERVSYMRMSQSGLALLVSPQGGSMIDLAAGRDSPCKPSMTIIHAEDLAISADGRFAITARSRTEPAPAGGMEFSLWELPECRQRASVSVSLFSTVGAMNFVSDSEIIVQGRIADQRNYPIQYNDGWLKLTIGPSTAELHSKPFSSGVPENVGRIAWNPGSWLAVVKLSGGKDTIRVRDLHRGTWVGDGFDRDKTDGVGITESANRLAWSDGLGALVVTSPLDTQYRRCVPFASVDLDKHRRTYAIRFSRDGQWVFAAMGDDGVVICDAPSGQFLGRLRRIGGSSGADDLYFYDASSLLVTSMNEELLVWDLRPETMRRLACDRAHRNLSMTEWKELLGSEPYHCVCPEFPPGEGADARATGCAGSRR
jgi:WD40 repeat protein